VSGFTFHRTEIEGIVIIEHDIHLDHRGSFIETYRADVFQNAGLPDVFLQDNQSVSKKGTLRGLHFQLKRPQGKLVRAAYGTVFDVAVDIRPGSPTFGQWYGCVLSGENSRQLYVPPGFAHGFLVLTDGAVVQYKCTAYYEPDDQWGIRWDDPDIAIDWPLGDIERLIISRRDESLKRLSEIRESLDSAGLADF
jgi:dTDP-4-dehydrorhamnose 3,5-epimerase